jgi:hypothetical protein
MVAGGVGEAWLEIVQGTKCTWRHEVERVWCRSLSAKGDRAHRGSHKDSDSSLT